MYWSFKSLKQILNGGSDSLNYMLKMQKNSLTALNDNM